MATCIEFVAELPVTPLGKLDKKAMRDAFTRRGSSPTGAAQPPQFSGSG
jgi:non-ribosomal peptide synthetase component E (peptide arylation enzyme)